MVPELAGSYEEIPPSLIDFATRDRRWCQGNLQHSRILAAKGLRPMSRVHLGMGIMAYVSALVWLLFLITALSLTVQELTFKPSYFDGDQPLFPTWPMQDSERAMSLLFCTLALLLLPKLFGLLTALFNGARRRGFGGIWGLFSGVVMETILSSLFAHVMMIVQSAAIFDIIRGRDSGWNPQRRDDGSLPLSWAVRYHLLHMILGTALAVFTFMASLPLFLWVLPATLGLTFSGPLSAASAKRAWGERFKALGIFVIPEERHPPAIRSRRGINPRCWHAISPSTRPFHSSRGTRNCVTFIASSSSCSRSRARRAFHPVSPLDAPSWRSPPTFRNCCGFSNQAKRRRYFRTRKALRVSK